MQEIKCILCHNDQTSIIESIDTSRLVSLYEKRAGIDVRKYFNTAVIEYVSCNHCGLKFYWPQAIGDGRFYDQLQNISDYYLKEKAEFNEAAKFVKETDTVLEIGCGEGLFANHIKSKCFTGLEFSDDAIRKAKERRLKILKQSIQEHAVQNQGKYDVVCYFQVLEHVQHPGFFISESLKCLRPGGKLFIAVPSEDSFINEVSNFYLNMPPHHAARWTDEALKRIAALFNLEVIHLFHEQLHSAHSRFFATTRLFKGLNNFFKRPRKTIDAGFGGKILYGIAVLASYLALPFLIRKNIQGQSVLIIFSKK